MNTPDPPAPVKAVSTVVAIVTAVIVASARSPCGTTTRRPNLSVMAPILVPSAPAVGSVVRAIPARFAVAIPMLLVPVASATLVEIMEIAD